MHSLNMDSQNLQRRKEASKESLKTELCLGSNSCLCLELFLSVTENGVLHALDCVRLL